MGVEIPFTKSDGSTSDPIKLASTVIGDALVNDTTPQLGGSLDVNGNDIVSVSNGNINIAPNGSGVVQVGGTALLANDTNNRITTATGSGTLNGEANLTFDGSTLTVTGDQHIANGSGLVVGNTSQVTSSGYVPELQVLGTGDADSSMSIGRWSADAEGPALHFIKSRNATIGSSTIVADGDLVGQLRFMVDDGSDFASHAATIRVEIDGTPGANDTPGAITFNTTADGASGGTERMRIDSNGKMSLNTSSPSLASAIFIKQATSDAAGGIILQHNSAGVEDSAAIYYETSDGSLRIANATDASGANATSDFVDNMVFAQSGQVKVVTSKASSHTFNVHNANASNPSGMQIYFAGVSSGDTTDYFYLAGDTGATRAINFSNGDWDNTNNSYSGFSDIKLKQDVTDARGYWDDFKALRYRKYRLKEEVARDENAGTQIGLVAQEMEAEFPNIVIETPDREMQDVSVLDEDGEATYEQVEKLDSDGNAETDDDGNVITVNKVDGDGNPIPIMEEKLVNLGTTTKSIKYSILHGPVMAIVVQELQTRLEAAEAKITALESA
jgi:hypothetical protein